MPKRPADESLSVRILVRVTPEFNKQIHEYLKSSDYKNPSEFIRNAMLLKMLNDNKYKSELDKIIQYIDFKFEILKEILDKGLPDKKK